MIRFAVKRLAAMVLILLVLTVIVFLLQKLSQVNPAHAYLGANAPAAAIKETHVLGYDKPLLAQYLTTWAGCSREPRGVAADPAPGVHRSRLLPSGHGGTGGLTALVLAVLLGALFGLVSAARFRGAGAFRLLLLGLASAPVFLLALLAILSSAARCTGCRAPATPATRTRPPVRPAWSCWMASCTGSRPSRGTASAISILPALVVAIGPAVSIGRVLRGSLEASMGSDFARTARAKGLAERTVVLRHALRNSASAALSMTGLQVGLMFAGVVVVESIFAWPGIGLYVDQSIPQADFPAIAGVTLVLGIGYVVINAVVDILQAVVDPRVALE